MLLQVSSRPVSATPQQKAPVRTLAMTKQMPSLRSNFACSTSSRSEPDMSDAEVMPIARMAKSPASFSFSQLRYSEIAQVEVRVSVQDGPAMQNAQIHGSPEPESVTIVEDGHTYDVCHAHQYRLLPLTYLLLSTACRQLFLAFAPAFAAAKDLIKTP